MVIHVQTIDYLYGGGGDRTMGTWEVGFEEKF